MLATCPMMSRASSLPHNKKGFVCLLHLQGETFRVAVELRGVHAQDLVDICCGEKWASLAVSSLAAAGRVPQGGHERTGDGVAVEGVGGRVDARDRHEAEQRVGDEHLISSQQLGERHHAFAEAG